MKNKKEHSKFYVLIQALIIALISQIFAFIIAFVALFILGYVMNIGGTQTLLPNSLEAIVTNISGIIGYFVAGLYVIHKLKKENSINFKERISFKGTNFKYLLGLILFVLPFIYTINYVLVEVIKLNPQPRIDIDLSLKGIIEIFLIIIMAPIIEEVTFRFGIIEKMESKYSKVTSIIVSALIFGALHFYNLNGSIIVLLIGLIFGLIYSKSRNLIYVIVLHFVNNLFSVIQALVYKNDPNSLIVTFQSTPIHIIIFILLMFIGAFLIFKEKDKVKHKK